MFCDGEVCDTDMLFSMWSFCKLLREVVVENVTDQETKDFVYVRLFDGLFVASRIISKGFSIDWCATPLVSSAICKLAQTSSGDPAVRLMWGLYF